MCATDLIRRLRSHHAWANDRLLVAARSLPADALARPIAIGQDSLLAMLTHLYAAEFVWLEAIEGNANPISPFEIRFASLDELAAAWLHVDARWARLMSSLDDAALDRAVLKRSTSSGAGATFIAPLGDVLLHLFTHAQYTSAQVKVMLRQLGVDPLPDVMLITQTRLG